MEQGRLGYDGYRVNPQYEFNGDGPEMRGSRFPVSDSEQYSSDEHFDEEDSMQLEHIIVEGIKLHNIRFMLDYDTNRFTCSDLNHMIWTTSGLATQTIGDIEQLLEPHRIKYIRYLQELPLQITEFIHQVEEISNRENLSQPNTPRHRILGKIHADLDYFFDEMPREAYGHLSNNPILGVYSSTDLTRWMDQHFKKEHAKMCTAAWTACYRLSFLRIRRLLLHYPRDITQEVKNLCKMLAVLFNYCAVFMPKCQTPNPEQIQTDLFSTLVETGTYLLSQLCISALVQGTQIQNAASLQRALKIAASSYNDIQHKLQLFTTCLTNRTKIFDQCGQDAQGNLILASKAEGPRTPQIRPRIRKDFRWHDNVATEQKERLHSLIDTTIAKNVQQHVTAELQKISVSRKLEFSLQAVPRELQTTVYQAFASVHLRNGVSEIVKDTLLVPDPPSHDSTNATAHLDHYSLAIIQLDEILTAHTTKNSNGVIEIQLVDTGTLIFTLEFIYSMVKRICDCIEDALTKSPTHVVDLQFVDLALVLTQTVRAIRPVTASLIQSVEQMDDALEKRKTHWPNFDDLVNQLSNLENDYVNEQIQDKVRGFYEANAQQHIVKHFTQIQWHTKARHSFSLIPFYAKKSVHATTSSTTATRSSVTTLNIQPMQIYPENSDYSRTVLELLERSFPDNLHKSRRDLYLQYIDTVEQALSCSATALRRKYNDSITGGNSYKVPTSRYCVLQ